jgi:hypothetical protein
MKEGIGLLSFIAQIVSALAWPTTVFGCVVLLRRHIAALVPLLRSVKYSDVELQFGKEIAELARTAESSSLPQVQTSTDPKDPWSEIATLAEVRPRTAIRLAFRKVEESALEAARKRNIEITDAAAGMPMVVGAILLGNGVISSAQYDILTKLRKLVQEAEEAHRDSIRPESALEFVYLASRLANSISA